jgi:VWFA-related protein
MTRPTPALIVAAAVLAAGPLPAQQVFRSGVEGVVVDVWVRDGKRPVANLTAKDFQLRDNGVSQGIRDFTVESLPLDVTLTLDVSGSIARPQLDRIEHAERQVLNALHPTDRCRILTFTTKTVERAPMAPATPALPPLTSGGGTALFDAAAQTLIAVPDPDRRRFAIVMTDGGENRSVVDASTLLEAAKASDVVLDFVFPMPGNTELPPETNWNLLERVAHTTGGQMIRLTHDDLGAGFVAAIDDFRVSYRLRYVPQDVKRSGWHEIKVDVVQPATASPYTVRARKGYYSQ